MKKRVLVLDDDEDIRGLMEFILAREGYEVIGSGETAVLKELNEMQPDLVLMDNRLGDGLGKDICRKLKEDPATANFKIVLVSAIDNLEMVSRESKADACLQKPFDIEQLTKLVASLL